MLQPITRRAVLLTAIVREASEVDQEVAVRPTALMCRLELRPAGRYQPLLPPHQVFDTCTYTLPRLDKISMSDIDALSHEVIMRQGNTSHHKADANTSPCISERR